MACKFKNECPSYSGWCESSMRDYSRCIPFLVTAYDNLKNKKSGLRSCAVMTNGKSVKGKFHRWEDYSYVIEPSPMIGGTHVYAIVELEDGSVERVDPSHIRFTDAEGDKNEEE